MKPTLAALFTLALLASPPLLAQETTPPLSWTSAEGKPIQGKFVKWDGEAVVIIKDGKDVILPFTRLAAASVAQEKKPGGGGGQPTTKSNTAEASSSIAGPPVSGKEIKIALPSGVDLKLCGIPAGEHKFTIALRLTEAQLSGFWMGKYEVTQSQWEAVMGNNPSEFKGRDLPVEKVNWDDARAFVAKLNKIAPPPEGWSWSLPTTTQWSYACYTGNRKTKFHFGDSLNGTQANVDGTKPFGTDEKGPSLGKTAPVGSYAANAWGLHDMHGNVAEWCRDAGMIYGNIGGGIDFSPKDARTGKDPLVPMAFAISIGPSLAGSRQTTGGSWKDEAQAAQYMNGGGSWWPFSERSPRIGLRVAIVPAEVAVKPD